MIDAMKKAAAAATTATGIMKSQTSSTSLSILAKAAKKCPQIPDILDFLALMMLPLTAGLAEPQPLAALLTAAAAWPLWMLSEVFIRCSSSGRPSKKEDCRSPRVISSGTAWPAPSTEHRSNRSTGRG